MYTTPVTLLVGQAGSGKDTVAGFMVKNHGAIAIAQADPMKRLGKILFDFTEDQLWGPSDSRNAEDSRSSEALFWARAEFKIRNDVEIEAWINDVFRRQSMEARSRALTGLKGWFQMVCIQTFSSGRLLTPRFMLQTLGTEWGRNQSKDLWSDYTIEAAFQLLSGGFRYDRVRGLFENKTYAGPARVVITDGRFRNEVINVRRVGGAVVRIDSPNVDTSATEKAGVAGHASEKEQQGLPKHFFTHFILNDKSQGLNSCEENVAILNEVLNRDDGYRAIGYGSSSP